MLQRSYGNPPYQAEEKSTEDFVRRFKIESRDVKRAPEIMRILGFMHGITNPELIKRLHDKIPKSVDEKMRITTSFLRGEVAASNQEQKRSFSPWKLQDAGHKQNFKKGGHNTDECMHLKRQIEELLKNGKLSHVIKELKQNSEKDQPKTNKKGDTSSKDKALAILMGSVVKSYGYWDSLLVKIGDEEHSTSAWMNFVIVTSSSPYNGIIGRPGVRKIQAVPSTAHEMLKFPVA
ncbi:hypothetical protein Tco_1100748 [Tanacetum coccineum]